ncbi:MAG: hypothetical protein CVV42_06585 [Candidatus Riflebacteria bacterium HGW-Riflebacteria-2]|jgi:hypothetical protein|nr:MAG: hypothetical protein CVV42_06585 [Candidatus Riflebacteria bacterium HGW-Riflebacteria-2]
MNKAMKEKNRFFAEVEAVDARLLQASAAGNSYSLRQRDADRIVLFSLAGHMINIVNKELGCGPDFIMCGQLPSLDQPLAEDGWKLADNCLKIPFLTQLKLAGGRIYDSTERFAIRDFPGHMKSLIARQIRKEKTAELSELEGRLNRLSETIQKHLIELSELPLIGVIGFGSGFPACGDAALCGLLLTARNMALGRRFRVGWYKRLTVELKRFVHRTGPYGRNWLHYAIEGRMTEMQQHFFHAMLRDFECSDEIVVKKIAADRLVNGIAFLMGVNSALDMVQAGFFNP